MGDISVGAELGSALQNTDSGDPERFEKIGAGITKSGEPGRATRELRDFARVLGVYPNGEDISEVSWRCLIGDDSHSALVEDWEAVFESEQTGFDLLPGRKRYVDLMEFLRLSELDSEGKLDVRVEGFDIFSVVLMTLTSAILYSVLRAGIKITTLDKVLWSWGFGSALGYYGLKVRRIWMKSRLSILERREIARSERVIRFSKTLRRMDFATHRRLCATSRGYLAFAPPRTSIGDEIFQVAGTHVPFLLRSKGRAAKEGHGRATSSGCNSSNPVSELYELIGDVYLHGLMTNKGFEKLGGVEKRIRII